MHPEIPFEKLENLDFTDIVLSLKASSVPLTVEGTPSPPGRFDYPLHLWVTAVGTVRAGAIKSAVGLGVFSVKGDRRYREDFRLNEADI